jgi:hypothetical protein
LHLICDNYGTHKHPAVERWLTAHPRIEFHFTPTSASWLNLVERLVCADHESSHPPRQLRQCAAVGAGHHPPAGRMELQPDAFPLDQVRCENQEQHT